MITGPNIWTARHLQGRRDLNPRPSVLETGALPTELLPSATLTICQGQRPITTYRTCLEIGVGVVMVQLASLKPQR